MSIMMPSGLEWVAKLAGGDWPEADEDKLWDLQQAHLEYAKSVRAVAAGLGPVIDDVKSGVSGATSEQFEQYLRQVQSNLGQVADSADQVADMCDKTALQVQYAKIMILMMLAWMAAEIAFLAWWCPEGVAAIVAAGRAAVMMIVRRLLAMVAINVGMAGAMDALAQLIQFREGRRHSWDLQNTEMALGAGAISGAITGVLFEVGGVIAPNFLGSLLGKVTVGGVGGGLSMEATDAAFGMDGDPGLGFLAGALGGAIGHIPALRGGKGGDGGKIDRVPDMSGESGLGDVPDLSEKSVLDGKGLGEGGDSSGYTRVSTGGKEFQSPTAGGRRYSDVPLEGAGSEEALPLYSRGVPPEYSSRRGSSTRSAPDQLGESGDGRGGYLAAEGGSESGQGEGSGHSDARWESSGSEGATPEGPGLRDFPTRRNPNPWGLSEDRPIRVEGGSEYGQGASDFGGQHGAPAAFEPGGSFRDVQAPPAADHRIGEAPHDLVLEPGLDGGHGDARVAPPVSEGIHEDGRGRGYLAPEGGSGYGRGESDFGGWRDVPAAVEPGGPISHVQAPPAAGPRFGYGGDKGDEVSSRGDGLEGEELTRPHGLPGFGTDGVTSPASVARPPLEPVVSRPEAITDGRSAALAPTGRLQEPPAGVPHEPRTLAESGIPHDTEPLTKGSVEQLQPGGRSVEDWLNRVTEHSGSDIGVPLPGQTHEAAEPGLLLGPGPQTEPHEPPVGRAPQQIGSGIRPAGAAPRSRSSVEGVSAGAEPPVTGDVQTGRDEVGGLARLEGSEPVPPAPPSRGVPVGQEPRGVSETAPESRTANSSGVRHGGPSDGGRTPQDGAARAGHGGAPTDRADGPFAPETMRERAARPDTVTGRDRDGNDFALRLREGSTALFDASGELRHVVLPDGVSFERGFDGLWGPPR
ncbi:hypothetical protein ACFZAR_44255, partial [Streptomyces sp. NPDC008222]